MTRSQHCRICRTALFAEPLLRYNNMPKAAQFLPDAAALPDERGIDIEVCQCSGCGLVQLSNEPVPYFREVVRAAAFSPEMREFRIKQFGDFLDVHGLRGRKVLEVGCGRGEFLALMQNCGADAYGLEYAEDAVRQCAEAGLKVSQGFVDADTQRLGGAPFDAFFMLNFLEHLPDPNATLRGIGRNLTDDGTGLVEVPNFDMILRRNLFSEFMSDHLFYFTRETLGTALALNGFEIIECREVWYEYILSVIIKKRKKTDISHFYGYQAELRGEVERYVHGFGKGRVAIWGAGHQALTAISLLGLADMIRYVVDSAPFKQGKFTPATHIPIVPPEALVSDPVDAVIVMAASYADEVARIIRRDFDGHMSVSILREFGLEVVHHPRLH